MSKKTELDPSLFELEFNGSITNQKQNSAVHDDKDKLHNNMLVRVAVDDMERVLAHVVRADLLKNHGIESRTDWMDSVAEQAGAKFPFDRTFDDHRVSISAGGKSIAAFSDCELTTFRYDVKQTILTFHIVARGATPTAVGKTSGVLKSQVHFEFARAAHWSEQQGMFNEGGENAGDADKQTDINPETGKKIERAKDKANKNNTDKARNRTPAKDKDK